MNSKPSGFTLFELLLSIGLIAVVLAVAAPLVAHLKMESDLNTVMEYSTATLRRAQLLSRNSTNTASWGCNVQVGSITLFQGTSYAARDTNYDETWTFSQDISLAGVTETVFATFTGVPSSSGVLRFTSTNGISRYVTITSDGAIYY